MSRASGAGSVRTAGERDHICTEAFGDPNAPARRRRSGLAKRAAGSRSDLVKAIPFRPRRRRGSGRAAVRSSLSSTGSNSETVGSRRCYAVYKRRRSWRASRSAPGPALDDDALRRARSAGGVSV